MGFIAFNLVCALFVAGGLWLATRPTRRPEWPDCGPVWVEEDA